MRRGWCLGDVAFRKELLAQVSEQRGAHHYGAELQEGEEDKAERLVREELARRRWLEKELGQQTKTDRQKARIAHRAAPAAGDEHDVGVDCAAIADGKREHIEEHATLD